MAQFANVVPGGTVPLCDQRAECRSASRVPFSRAFSLTLKRNCATMKSEEEVRLARTIAKKLLRQIDDEKAIGRDTLAGIS